MKSISKTMLRTCAGLAAAAALVVGGAGMASAATTSPATHHNFWYGCNPWQREQWNLNGNNSVEVPWNGGTLTYTVTFTQAGSCLSGTLTDPYYAGTATGPIWGSIYGNNNITFSFKYPTGSIQGTRTFTGSISRRGSVSGTWSETGSEKATGTWSLADRAHRACPWWAWPGAACPVHP